MMKRTALSVLSIILLFTMVLSACSSEQESKVTGPAKLHITGANADSIQEEYANYYALTHKNVEIETSGFMDGVNMEDERPFWEIVKAKLDGENAPDVLIVDLQILGQLAKEGYLQPLDSLAREKKSDFDQFIPTVLDAVKAKGEGGTLYGIPLSFNSQALFYNKDLFDAAGIPYPTDHMSWDEIFALARQLSDGVGEERQYGLEVGDYQAMELINLQAAQKGLMLFSDDLQTVMLDTPEWRQLWQEMKDLIDEGVASPAFDWEAAMNSGIEPGPFAGEPFLEGKAAMAVKSSYDVANLDERFQWAGEELQPFNWDIVTIPVQKERPNYGGVMNIYEVAVINKNTANLDAAWDFVSYITGDDLAKVKSSSNYGSFLPRAEHVRIEGKELNYEALYKLEPMESQSLYPEEAAMKYPDWWEVVDPFYTNLMKVIQDDADVDTAIKEGQKQMEEALVKVLANKDGEQN